MKKIILLSLLTITTANISASEQDSFFQDSGIFSTKNLLFTGLGIIAVFSYKKCIQIMEAANNQLSQNSIDRENQLLQNMTAHQQSVNDRIANFIAHNNRPAEEAQ